MFSRIFDKNVVDNPGNVTDGAYKKSRLCCVAKNIDIGLGIQDILAYAIN